MRRRQDWPERLYEYLATVRDTPFEWGVHDCITMAAGAVLAMTDEDPLVNFPKWSSMREAAVIMKDAGGLVNAVNTQLGAATQVAPAFAGRGDIMYVTNGNDALIGVCIGEEVAVPSTENMQYLSRANATVAWRIG